jgi:hypothetical protein
MATIALNVLDVIIRNEGILTGRSWTKHTSILQNAQLCCKSLISFILQIVTFNGITACLIDHLPKHFLKFESSVHHSSRNLDTYLQKKIAARFKEMTGAWQNTWASNSKTIFWGVNEISLIQSNVSKLNKAG